MEVFDLSEKNELDTFQFHMEMRLKALHKKNLIKAKKFIIDSITDQLRTTSVIPKDTEDVWFLYQAIWR